MPWCDGERGSVKKRDAVPAGPTGEVGRPCGRHGAGLSGDGGREEKPRCKLLSVMLSIMDYNRHPPTPSGSSGGRLLTGDWHRAAQPTDPGEPLSPEPSFYALWMIYLSTALPICTGSGNVKIFFVSCVCAELFINLYCVY